MNRAALPHDWFPRPIPDNVMLGDRSWLYSSFAFCHYQSRRPAGVRVGHDTGLYNGTFFDLGPDGEVSIGHYCTIVGAIMCSNGRVEIGDYVFIAHDVVLADAFAARPSVAADAGGNRAEGGVAPATSIAIGENAWIGVRAILLQGARIGEGAVVGAGAVVDFDVPPYSVVAGNPPRIVKRLR